MNRSIRWWLVVASVFIVTASATSIEAKQTQTGTEWEPVPGAVIPASFSVEYKKGSLASSKAGKVNIDWSGIQIKSEDAPFLIEPTSIRNMQLWTGNNLFELIHNWLIVDYVVNGKSASLNIRFADDGPGSQPPYPMLFSMYYLWKYSSLPEPDRFEFSIKNVEAYEASGGVSSMSGYMDGNKKQLAMLDHAGHDLDVYLSQQAPNSDAGLLKVRLLRNKMMLTPTVFAGGKIDKGSSPEFYREAQKIIDNILSVSPRHAEAHYWKARLYGMAEPKSEGGKLKTEPRDLEKATHHALKAVEIKPDKMLYREAAAVYFIEQGKWDEARDIVRGLDSQHPIVVLVSDMQEFPIPSGAIRLEDMSEATAEMTQQQGLGYGSIRAQSIMVPMSVESLTTFYKDKWKNFRFFKEKNEPDLYLQFVKLYGGKMKPSMAKSELPKPRRSGASQMLGDLFHGLGGSKKNQGMMMMVIDGAKVDIEHRKLMQAPEQGDFCTLQLINMREF